MSASRPAGIVTLLIGAFAGCAAPRPSEPRAATATRAVPEAAAVAAQPQPSSEAIAEAEAAYFDSPLQRLDLAGPQWRIRDARQTTQPDACVFSGTLQLGGVPLASDAALKVQAMRIWRIDVTALVPSAKPGEPARIEATWPLQGSYWLAAREWAFQLASRQDLVKGHIWFPVGTRVVAGEAQHGQVRVRRPAAVAPGLSSLPELDRTVSCETLVLSRESSGVAVGAAKTPTRQFAREVLLYAQAKGNLIGRLPLSVPMDFRVLDEAEDGWKRIAGDPVDGHADGGPWSYVPYAFDAWTNSPSSESEAYGTGRGVFRWAPTHRTQAALPLFERPDAQTPIATVAPDVVIGASDARAGFVTISIPGIYPAPGGHLWVSEAELARAAVPLAW